MHESFVMPESLKNKETSDEPTSPINPKAWLIKLAITREGGGEGGEGVKEGEVSFLISYIRTIIKRGGGGRGHGGGTCATDVGLILNKILQSEVGPNIFRIFMNRH